MGTAGTGGRTMRRRSAGVDEQPGSVCGPWISGSSHPRPTAGHAIPLTEDRLVSRLSVVDRTYLGNVGRYAIISDIHANLEALQAVLEDVARQQVERIVCLGDIVGYHANPAECLAVVRG